MEDVQKYKLRSLSNITTYIIFRVVLFFVFALTVGWKINDILIYFCAVQGCEGEVAAVFTFTYGEDGWDQRVGIKRDCQI